MNLRELIQSTDDRQLTPVATPEWPEADGKLYARKLSCARKVEVMGQLADSKECDSGAAFFAFIVALCVCDSEGAAVFEPDDWKWIKDRDSAVVERLFTACDQLNRFSKASQQELEKNCEAPADSAGS